MVDISVTLIVPPYLFLSVLGIGFKGLGRLVLKRSGKNSWTVLDHHYSHAPIHFLNFSVMAEK